MSGLLLPMPPGDPAAMESYASSLSSAAARIRGLASKTATVASGVRSKAKWSGGAAERYSASAGSLAQSVGATAPHLDAIAAAVRGYASALRTARQKVAAYNKAVEAATCLAPKRQQAALAALAGRRENALWAVNWAQEEGNSAAQEVAGSEQNLLEVSNPFAAVGTTGPNIQSEYLLQQVQQLDQQQAAAAANVPHVEALAPGQLQREEEQAEKRREFFNWLAGGDLPGALPDNPHVPEEGGDPGPPVNQGDKDIPYIPDPVDGGE